MKTPIGWALVAIGIVATSGRGAGPSPSPSEVSRQGAVARLEAEARYFEKAGKPRSAALLRQKIEAVQAGARPAGVRIYVPIIRVEGMSKAEALLLTEVTIKAIESDTAYKVVGSPDDADFLFEAKITPKARGGR